MRTFLAIMTAAALIGCTGTTTEVRERAPLTTRGGAALRGASVAVLPFGGPNGPATRDVVIRVLAEQEGANVISPSQVDGFLWNARLQPSAYDQSTMSSISAGLHAPLVVWGEVDQFTPCHFDRLVPATPAYVEMTINTWSMAEGRTRTATINRQGSLPFTIWDKQPTFQDVTTAEVSDFFAGRSPAAARFVPDSPLEGDGFELSVPPEGQRPAPDHFTLTAFDADPKYKLSSTSQEGA